MESTFGCENKLCLGLFLHLFVLGFGGLFATLRSSRSGATTGTTSHVLPNLGNSLVGGINFSKPLQGKLVLGKVNSLSSFELAH
ncbi:hypothetical protein SDJN02_22544, partial [Cucurbita argyrosperma subsp. argyrosperma]